MAKKHFPNMVTFTTVRRGDWRFKVSVFEDKHVLLVAQHAFNYDVYVRFFTTFNTASDFIDHLVEQDKL